MPEKLQFDLNFEEIPVDLSGTRYILREINGTQRDEYMTKSVKRVKYKDGKPSGLTSMAGLESSLLSMCLFGPDGEAVEESEIKKWPSKAVHGLFKAAQKLNGMEDDEKQMEDLRFREAADRLGLTSDIEEFIENNKVEDEEDPND